VDTATALPSGWHPDGTGVRWWNGTAWSQQAIPLPRRSLKIVQSTSLDLQTVRLSYQPPPPLLFPSPQVGCEEPTTARISRTPHVDSWIFELSDDGLPEEAALMPRGGDRRSYPAAVSATLEAVPDRTRSL
jgi:hypothetical protein